MANTAPYNAREQFRLMGLKFKVHKKNFFEFLSVIAKYYFKSPGYAKTDLSLLTFYFGNSPFNISKRFLALKGEKELHAYGETPLTTLDRIADECQISSKDAVFELGCGRARTCFWLNSLVKCKVVGIDFVPEFIQHANTIKERFSVDGVSFRNEDILETDFSGATVIYLYGTSLEPESIKKLIEKFRSLPVGTKIITVSYSLNEFTDNPFFEVMKRFTAPFTWGVGDVYLQVRK